MSDTEAPDQTPDPVYLRWMEEHHQESKRRENYSIARIDLLVISISGAGLYIAFESIRFILLNREKITDLKDVHHWPLITVGILLALAIMANFASQYFGFRCNKAAAQWARFEYREKSEGDTYPETAPLKCQTDLFGWWTRFANGTSIILMVLGVVGLIIFNFLLL